MNDLKITLTAALVLVALVALWLVSDQRSIDENIGPFPVLSIDPASISEILVKNAGSSFILSRQKDSTWLVDDFRADSKNVDELVDSLSSLKAERILNQDPGPGETGLSPPLAEISWKTGASSSTHLLLIGKSNRLAGTSYVRLDGDKKIFMVRTSFLLPFLGDAVSFRSKEIARIPFSRLEKLTIERSDGRIVFERTGEGDFLLHGSCELKAYAPKLCRLTEELSNLHARNFSPFSEKALDDYGLSHPGIRVTAVFREPLAPVVLSVGKRVPASRGLVYLYRNGAKTVHQVEAMLLSSLSASEDEFRDRSPFSISGEKPDSAWFTSNRKPRFRVQLVKYVKWCVLKSGKTSHTKESERMMAKLKDLPTKCYRRFSRPNLAALGLENPDLIVELAAQSDPPTEFPVGVSKSGRAYVLLPDQGVAEIPPKIVEEIENFIRAYGYRCCDDRAVSR